MAEYPIIKEGEYYLSIETEHFYFDVYKSWNGTGGGAMFRAGSYVKKKGDRKYFLDFELFAEWDYKDKQTAFEEAKSHIFEYMKHLSNELLPTADVVEVKHGEWIKHKRNILKMREFHRKGMGLHMSEKSIFWTCSCCNQWGNVHDKYCSVCGAKMDGGKE